MSKSMDERYFPYIIKAVIDLQDQPETLEQFMQVQKDNQLTALLETSRWLNQVASVELKRRVYKMVHCVCDQCDFEISAPDLKQLQHDLIEIDGAFIGDGEGGSLSICPTCKLDGLSLTD